MPELYNATRLSSLLYSSRGLFTGRHCRGLTIARRSDGEERRRRKKKVRRREKEREKEPKTTAKFDASLKISAGREAEGREEKRFLLLLFIFSFIISEWLFIFIRPRSIIDILWKYVLFRPEWLRFALWELRVFYIQLHLISYVLMGYSIYFVDLILYL